MKGEVESGWPLVAKVKERMSLEATSVGDLADRLQISQSYLSQLLLGDKAIVSASSDLVRRIAGYLYLPPVVCFVLAGKLESEDFATCNYDEQLRSLERRVALIADSTFALEAGVSKEMLIRADPRVLTMIVSIYQALLGPGEMISRGERWAWLGAASGGK